MPKAVKKKPRKLTDAERDRIYRERSAWQQGQMLKGRATAEGKG